MKRKSGSTSRAVKGPGRPAKPEGEKLKALPVRCKDSERKAYEKAAARENLKLAEWVRQTLNKAVEK